MQLCLKKSAHSPFGLEVWEKKHFGMTALRPKFGNFHDVSMPPLALVLCSMQRTIG